MSGFILTNTVQHVIQSLQFRAYAPGLVTAILCSMVCLLVNILLVCSGEIFVPYYILCVLGIPTILKTIKMKNEMTPEVRRIHEFFIGMEKALHSSK